LRRWPPSSDHLSCRWPATSLLPPLGHPSSLGLVMARALHASSSLPDGGPSPRASPSPSYASLRLFPP
jgi:hypothetical protein